jgi:hypothetical protein
MTASGVAGAWLETRFRFPSPAPFSINDLHRCAGKVQENSCFLNFIFKGFRYYGDSYRFGFIAFVRPPVSCAWLANLKPRFNPLTLSIHHKIGPTGASRL